MSNPIYDKAETAREFANIAYIKWMEAREQNEPVGSTRLGFMTGAQLEIWVEAIGEAMDKALSKTRWGIEDKLQKGPR